EDKSAEVEAILREDVQREPGDIQAHEKLARFLWSHRDWAGAEKEFYEAFRLGESVSYYVPYSGRDPENIEDCLLAQERYVDFEQLLREAIRSGPDSADLHFSLARFLADREEYDQAEAEYREGTRLAPGDAWNLSYFGSLLMRQQKYAEAEAVLRRVVEL